MISFRTIIEPKPSAWRITHKNRIQLHGSCFTDNIGQKMNDYLFRVKINPFGVVYNPVSIMNSLGMLIDQAEFTPDDLEFRNELWFSWDHHGSFSNPDREECLKKINKEIRSSSRHLRESDYLIITFGTAWIYRLKKNGQVVSNCHKVPASEFDRILLGTEEIVALWGNLIPDLLKINPGLRIIFTVSPVRHWKDGAHGNQLSKAILLLSIDKLCRAFPGNTEYFPAYEIILDDLRDYRFYNEDLLHPNSQAIDYTWHFFEKVYFDKDILAINREIEKIITAKNHRPYNTDTQAYRKFRKKMLMQIAELSEKFPFLETCRIL